MATITEVLSELKEVRPSGDGFVALCPAHEDRVPSLSVSEGYDGRVLLNCHAGCSTAHVCMAMGHPLSWLYPDDAKRLTNGRKRHDASDGELVATYDYIDADGVLQFQALRFEQPDGEKTFMQRRPNGKGGWIYDRKGTTNVPYRLPELLKSHASETVWIAEGERKVDAIRQMGLVATCNVGGAGKWLKTFKQHLAGRDVVILPDNDERGQQHAAKVYQFLKSAATSIRVLNLPNLPPKGDVVDWIAAGGTKEQLLALAGEVSADVIPEPPQPEIDAPHDEEILQRVGIEVLSEDDSGRIKVFSFAHRKTESIRDVNRFTFVDLLRLCGRDVREVVCPSGDTSPGDRYQLSEVKQAIATIAGHHRESDQTELGVGVWRDDQNRVILVGKGEALSWDGATVERHTKPRHGGQVLDFGNGDDWFDPELLSKHLSEYTVDWARQTVDELEEIFSRWWFGSSLQAVVPAVLTGLVLATWVQSLWTFRPQVFVLGKSNSGKSKLFELLCGTLHSPGLFGRHVITSGDISAAGLIDSVGNTSKAVILDELEHSKRRDSVFSLLRNSSRGQQKVRSSSSGKIKKSSIEHITWAAATESGLRKEADRNRFIIVNTLIPPSAKMGNLKLPKPKEAWNLGQKLLALAVRTASRAVALSEELKSSLPDGVHYRVGESYSVPAAAYAVATGRDDADARLLLQNFLHAADGDEIEGDEVRLLDAILQTRINVKGGEWCSVQQALYRRLDPDVDWALASHGIHVLESPDAREKWIDGEELCVFFAYSAVAKNVLSRDDEWRGVNCRELLSRLPKAEDCRKRVSGNHASGVLVGFSCLVLASDCAESSCTMHNPRNT